MATSSFDKRFILDEKMLDVIIYLIQATPIKEFKINLDNTKENELIAKRLLERGIFNHEN